MLASAALIFVVTLGGGARRGRWSRRVLTAGLAVALAAAVLSLARHVADDFLFAAYHLDGFTQSVKVLAVALALVALLAGRRDDGQWADARSDASLFTALTVLGLLAAASAADLVVLALAVAAVALGMVGVVAAGGRRAGTENAARRVLVGQLISSSLMLAGVALLAGIAGSTRFTDVAAALAAGSAPPVWRAGVVLLLAGFGAALGLPPLGGGVAALATRAAPGAAALGVGPVWGTAALLLCRVAAGLVPHDALLGTGAVVAGALVAGLGVVRAWRASDARVLIHALAVVQVGVLLATLAPQTPEAWAAALLVAAAAATAQAAATLGLAQLGAGERLGTADLAGLVSAAPAAGLAVAFGIATLAGVPPAAGFTARWAAASAGWHEGWMAAAVVIGAATLASAAAVAAPLKAVFARASGSAGARAGAPATVVPGLLAALLLAAGVLPAIVFRAAGTVAGFLR